ncbi:MAG TPA: hypothetical protein VMG09_17480 [Bacteroidota bacterium]|nr:hypothetical protein [Bacteroidota bacterium]
MEANEERRTKLAQLRREYRGMRSMIEMMQKGTEATVLRKMREDKLLPLEREIRDLEDQLSREG